MKLLKQHILHCLGFYFLFSVLFLVWGSISCLRFYFLLRALLNVQQEMELFKQHILILDAQLSLSSTLVDNGHFSTCDMLTPPCLFIIHLSSPTSHLYFPSPLYICPSPLILLILYSTIMGGE